MFWLGWLTFILIYLFLLHLVKYEHNHPCTHQNSSFFLLSHYQCQWKPCMLSHCLQPNFLRMCYALGDEQFQAVFLLVRQLQVKISFICPKKDVPELDWLLFGFLAKSELTFLYLSIINGFCLNNNNKFYLQCIFQKDLKLIHV